MTDIAPIREVLEGVGDLVPLDDRVALARSIAARLADPAAAADDGLRARRRVETAHDGREQLAAVLDRCAALVPG